MSLAVRPFRSLSSERGHSAESSLHPWHQMDGTINTLFNNLATDIRNVSVAVGIFAFMWGALQYATSGGSPHQLELGKTAMKASLVGVGAIVLASALVNLVFSALGGGAGAGAG
jgi:Type IV secretion system pilin